jgi:hypothetical protein
MKSLRSRLAEKVAATQDQAPAPTLNQSQSSNYSDFFNLVSEIRKLNQVINIKNKTYYYGIFRKYVSIIHPKGEIRKADDLECKWHSR